MSIPPVRDNNGTRPCLPPDLLRCLLNRAQARQAKVIPDKWTKPSPWKHIDALSAAMEAAKK